MAQERKKIVSDAIVDTGIGVGLIAVLPLLVHGLGHSSQYLLLEHLLALAQVILWVKVLIGCLMQIWKFSEINL